LIEFVRFVMLVDWLVLTPSTAVTRLVTAVSAAALAFVARPSVVLLTVLVKGINSVVKVVR
jgi:hypothetical protein